MMVGSGQALVTVADLEEAAHEQGVHGRTALVGFLVVEQRLDLASVQHPQSGPQRGYRELVIVGDGQVLAEGRSRRGGVGGGRLRRGGVPRRGPRGGGGGVPFRRAGGPGPAPGGGGPRGG